jgi:hypothetical protein
MYSTRLVFRALTTAALTLALPSPSHAECWCEFINGVVQPMCGSPVEIRPSCGQPVREWSVPVLVSPPPLRAESCKRAVLCDRHGFCRKKWVCD